METGGSLLVMMGEGGESRFETNLNFLLEEYGVFVNNGKYEFIQVSWHNLKFSGQVLIDCWSCFKEKKRNHNVNKYSCYGVSYLFILLFGQIPGVDFTKSRKSKINRKCDFQAFDWLKFTLTT